jgi:multidrug efflux pump subunit AcrB
VYNLTDDLRPGKREIHIRLKDAARPLGINAEAVARQLRGAFWGDVATEFQRGADNFEVRVRFDPSDRQSLADVDDFVVTAPAGARLPFHTVATAQPKRGFAKIVRVDSVRSVSVTADVDTARGNAAKILADLNSTYFPLFLGAHPGIALNLEGQAKEAAKTAGSVQRGLLIGLAIIYILLSFVFRSYIEPVVVMTAIPFGLIGAIFGHLVMGLDWTIPSTIGFVSLAGIVVNDSIILVRFIKNRTENGQAVRDAIFDAGKQRFRPVFLTSATTIAGLLPMLTETSLQAQFLVPMAASVSFGMLFATVLVLLLVPCEYRLLAAAASSAQRKH